MKIPFWKKQNTEKKDARKEWGGVGEFAENLARFFSPEPQKEKILRHEDFARAGDAYYATVSARYKVAQRVFVLLLVLFLLFSIFTNIREITYGNFFYLVRDFENAVDIESTNYETLSYDVYRDQTFSLYKGGMAAISPSNVSVFTATGRRSFSSRSDYVLPYSVASDKYLLVYDISGTVFSLYNSFSKVYTETLEYPVTDADISNSGDFAVLTRSSANKAVIQVYNEDMKLIGKFPKNLYALDLAIDSSGERMAVLYYDVGDGLGKTVLTVYDISERKGSDKREPDEGRVIFESEMEHLFPLSCAFTDKGVLSVVTDGSVTLFDKKYKNFENYEYSSEPSAVYTGENGTAVAFRSGTLNDINRIIAFDKDGKMLYNEVIRGAATEISLLGEYVFINSGSGVARLDTDIGELESYECQSGSMLVYDESTVMVCAESKAVYVKFKN